MRKKTFYLFFSIILNILSYEAPLSTPNLMTCSLEQEHRIVIFVHGIINIQPHLNFWNVIRFINDQIEDSIYVRAVEIMRKDSYFQQYSAMQGLGLQKINKYTIASGAAANCLAALLDRIRAKNSANQDITHYYTFGWSGLLSSRMRQLEAEMLYKSLIKELKFFQAQGIRPKVTIIGYSHGGNVTINLGLVHNQMQHPQMFIDQLILLGVPLIPENYQGITSPLFKKIYHFYSPGDRVQPIDCLSGGILLSSKIFKSHHNFSLPPNLQQIEYRVKRLAFKRNRKKIHSYHKKMLRNADPGHTELWSFGWVHNYRTHMPFYPLPAVAFVNYIIDYVEKLLPTHSHIIVDIRPFEESMLLTTRCSKHKSIKLPFLTNARLNEMCSFAELYMPQGCSKEVFEGKVTAAMEKATVEKSAEWASNKR